MGKLIAAKIRETSHNQVRDLYTQCQTNPTFILSRHHYLFISRSLEQCLRMDIDSITCWLRSVEDAKRALEYHNTQLRLQSNPFLPPFMPSEGRVHVHILHLLTLIIQYRLMTHLHTNHQSLLIVHLPWIATGDPGRMISYQPLPHL
jgi:hypothetical protein